MAEDPWSRVDCRRFVAWPERIRREWPFLERWLEKAPSRHVLDLGAATGEHSRHIADHGFDVTAIDSSPTMLERAGDTPLPAGVHLVQGDIANVAALVDRPAGAAICLGNTLPHLDDEGLRRLAAGLRTRLLPGAPVIVQVLNYAKILARGIRHLPLNFKPEAEGGEAVFLRLMSPSGAGYVMFTPTTLRYRPDLDPPVEVVATRSIRLRAWTWPEVDGAFHEAGFGRGQAFGDFTGSAYDPAESSDLVAVWTR